MINVLKKACSTRTLLSIALALLSLQTRAQAPKKISYQAVIRNQANDLVTNSRVGIRVSLLQETAIVYSEAQTPTTNANGLITIAIGAGSVITGAFENIDWSKGSYFIKTDVDLTGGSDYTITGIQQLLSVPFALYATTSGTSASGKTILSGVSDPTSQGADGDFFINTSTTKIFGPKTNGVWGSGTSLVGSQGAQGLTGLVGANGANGKTILNGASDPTTQGVDGDFYINTTTLKMFGPKTNSIWGNGTSLTGPQGVQGSTGASGLTGADGKTILSGISDPTTEGTNGDFFINTSTSKIFGPKVNGTWGTGISLVGPAGNVASLSIENANGFSGLVSNPSTTPSITLSTTVSGILKGDRLSISAAIPEDFPTLNQNTTGNAATVTTNANLTGPVTSSGNATAIANAAITNEMLANSAVANLSGTNTGDQTITLTGDVTGSGTGSFAVALANVNSTVGTFNRVTVNEKGLVMAGSNVISEAPLTFSTGLSRNANTITSDLSTGVGGGQSIFGGVNAGGTLSLSSTSHNTKGKIIIGTSAYDEANNRLGIGTSSPTSSLEVNGNLKITDGTQGPGKVLTSDATGAATWQTPTSGWGLSGNTGTVDGTSFIGTIDDVPFTIKVNNQNAGRIDRANYNSFYGYQAGNPTQSSFGNIAIGRRALFSNRASYNVAVGNSALQANTIGTENIALGTALYNNTSGESNVGIGALNENTTGSYNIAVGQALYDNTTGNKNIAIGTGAMFNNIAGSNGTAVGINAMYYVNRPGIFTNTNVAFGYESLQGSPPGSNPPNSGLDNSAMGYRALTSNTSGNGNTGMGYNSLITNITGNLNTALGYRADVASASLVNATAIGANAIASNSNSIQLGDNSVTQVLAGTGANATLVAGGLQITGGTPALGKVLTSDAAGIATWQTPTSGGWGLTGNSGTLDGSNFIGTTDNVPFNIRVRNQGAGRIDPSLANAYYGYLAGSANVSGFNNVALGSLALWSNTTGSNNCAIGSGTLNGNISGGGNVAIGNGALSANKASWNTAVGTGSLLNNTTGNYNAAIGVDGLSANTIGSSNIAIGNQALLQNVSGSNNSAIGESSLKSNRYGNHATAIGSGAMQYSNSQTTTFTNTNVAVGYQSLMGSPAAFANIGLDNTAIGYATLMSNTSGSRNFAGGNESLYSNNAGSDNVGTGNQTLYNNSSGASNTASGSNALGANTIGNNNTGIGYNSLRSNTTGSLNTSLGYQADVASASLVNATAIGANAQVTASNNMVFGDANVVGWGFGIRPTPGIDAIRVGTDGTNGNGATLSQGGTWTNASDRNKKENFKPIDGQELLSKLVQLPITRWNYKGELPPITHIGPMAQDFHKLFNVGSDDKSISTIDPSGISLAAIQELIKQNQELKKKVEGLSKENTSLKSQFSSLQSEFDSRLRKLEQSMEQTQRTSD